MSYFNKARKEYLETGTKFPREIIWAIGMVKAAASKTNYELGLLPVEKYRAIYIEALKLAQGLYDDLIDVDIFQTGSGTGLNLNVNEVIAIKAKINHGVKIHPLDDVNKSQSSNDVVPTAIRIAAIKTGLIVMNNLTELINLLEEKVKEYSDLVKPGRTHLRDALPVTLGQEFSGYVNAFKNDINIINHIIKYLSEIPLGGTAVGTGVNSPPEYREKVVQILSELTRLELKTGNTFRGLKLLTDVLHLSSVYRIIALELWRLGQDLRLMFSGPFTGIAEIDLESEAPGSSIMPGKKNPVTIESTMQAAIQIVGLDSANSNATYLGELELSMAIPITGYNIVKMSKLLNTVIRSYIEKIIPSIKPNKEKMRSLASKSLALLTILSPILGYDKVAKIIKRIEEGMDMHTALLREGVDPKKIEKILKIEELVNPGLIYRQLL